MALGRGKYGGVAEELLERFKAQGVMVVIMGGERGHGIECHGQALFHAGVPDILEMVAEEIRLKALADAAAIMAGEAARSESQQ